MSKFMLGVAVGGVAAIGLLVVAILVFGDEDIEDLNPAGGCYR